VAEPLKMESQSAAARQLVASTMRLGQLLQRRQIPFTMIDHQKLGQARVQSDGTLSIGGHRYRSFILPSKVQLPEPAAATAARFVEAKGRLLRDGAGDAAITPDALTTALQPAVRIQPASPKIAVGRFVRDGRAIVAVVNVGSEAYEGQLSVAHKGDWLCLDPATGTIEPATRAAPGSAALALAGRQTRLFVEQTAE
jgi:hypothetical protein